MRRRLAPCSPEAHANLLMAGFLMALISCAGFAAAAIAPVGSPDAGRGQRLFVDHCAACHAASPNAPPNVAPNLWGVVGRRAGTAAEYRYSRSMATSGKLWTAITLDSYLADPRRDAPAGRMPHPGLKTPADRADVIAYLGTLK